MEDVKVIYVAGPFRAETPWQIENNVRKAEEIALEIWKTDKAAAICPHSNSRYFHESASTRIFIEGYLEVLSRCDAIFMAPGWEESEGSQLEHDLAVKADIPIFFKLDDLKAWLEL